MRLKNRNPDKDYYILKSQWKAKGKPPADLTLPARSDPAADPAAPPGPPAS